MTDVLEAQWSGVRAVDLTDELWSQVEPHLARGIAGMDTIDSVRAAIDSREAQLWMTWEGQRCLAALVTKITDHPAGRVFTICHIGGVEMRSWIRHFERLEEYARENECNRMKIVGREGWARELSGFTKTAVVLEKELA